jgi:hypothetical protein
MCVEALLLSRDETTMRIVIRACEETLELRLDGDRWLDEQGRCVSIEAMIATAYQGGRQANTKYNATPTAANTAAAAIRSMTAGRTEPS